MRRSLFLAPFVLAACGNTGAIGDDTGEGDLGPGETFTMRVDSMLLAAEDDGFDLDDHATTSSSDPIGCGKVDASGGVDNALSGLQDTLSSFGVDLEALFSDAITSGDLVLDYTVSGYHGPDDADVLVDVTSNGELVASGVAGSVSGDVLSATIAELPMTGNANGTEFEITARNVEISLPMTGAPEAAEVSGGILGGGLPWDEAGEHDLRAVVLANLPSFVPESTAEGMVANVLDLQPTGNSGDCDAISVALIVTAGPQ